MPDASPSQSEALVLLIAAGSLLAASGIPGLLLGWRSAWGPRIATALVVLGSLVGFAGAILALAASRPVGAAGLAGASSGTAGPAAALLSLPSPLPGLDARLRVDAGAAFFSFPVFLIGGLGSIFGASYWSPRRHPRHGRRLRFCYGLLLSSLVFVLLAQGGFAFLVAWEAMALSTFFLVATEEESPEARKAGWLYLLYSHVSLLCLVMLFLVVRKATGELALAAIPADAPPGLRTAFLVLALVGFGTKAGALPVHSWLPAAHAAAPSHVSALMSGVTIKLGVYGLVRTCGLVASPPLTWGIALLVLGSASAFFGVVFALGQHDLKRLLAYHSIENVGIMLLGLGLAMTGRSLGRIDFVLLGIAGCLLHVWNHALFKSLLFFGAGAVTQAVGTRYLERTGGLAKRMPTTAVFFLVGSIAICGLPPLNGFVSELFLYLGLVRAAAGPGASWAALPAPVLASTGALAVACFVKVYGIVFLGTPRSEAAGAAREAPPLMIAPMAVLAIACAVLGAAPGLAVPALERAASVWNGEPLVGASLGSLAPLGWISASAAALIAATVTLWKPMAALYRRARRRQPSLATWDCGYAASTPRLQYTASSFAQIITSHFAWLLRARVERPRIEGLFPAPASFHTEVGDSVLDRLLAPAARRAQLLGALVRALPQGQLQRYILYIVAVALPLLVWALAGGGAAR
jgi:hydrogenase-4 component B